MIRDEVTTGDLAFWLGVSRVAVLKKLRKEGLKPVRRGAHRVWMWDRKAALTALLGDTLRP